VGYKAWREDFLESLNDDIVLRDGDVAALLSEVADCCTRKASLHREGTDVRRMYEALAYAINERLPILEAIQAGRDGSAPAELFMTEEERREFRAKVEDIGRRPRRS
jgi:hypothetical protein